jgi:hypothetical protein
MNHELNLCIHVCILCSCGPLVQSWCIRFEAKLNFAKHVGRQGNFKNICLSIGRRHQGLMAYWLNSDYLCDNLEVGPGM